MKFKAHAGMRSNPGFSLSNKLDPVGVSAHLQGTVSAEVGAVTIGIQEIPVRMRIPFLKRPGHLLVLGTVGPASIKVDPVTLSLKELSLQCGGVLGDKHGIVIKTDGNVTCKTEMDAEGVASGTIGVGSIDLGPEPHVDVTHRPAAA